MDNKETSLKVDYIFAHSFNHTLHAYIDITGDLIAGTLLSQILYWFSKTKDGKSRVRVFKEGKYWLAKGREEWFAEIRISPKQYDSAISKLKKAGFVETKIFKFRGVPTTHVRPECDVIGEKVDEWKKNVAKMLAEDEPPAGFTDSSNPVLPDGGNGIYPNGKMELPERGNSITETTTKTTNNFTESTMQRPQPQLFTPSPDGVNIYFPFQRKGSANSGRKNRYIPEDYTGAQLKEHIEPVIREEVEKCDEFGYTDLTQTTSEIIEIISAFYAKYYVRFRKRHRVLSDEAYRNIVHRYLNAPDEVRFYGPRIYYTLMDKYFDTKFNQKGRYDGAVEMSVSHFMTFDILQNLYYQFAKEIGVE